MDGLFVREMIATVVFWFGRILTFAIFIRVICSWLPFRAPDIIFHITEPILGPIRRVFHNSPLGGSMIDFSPIFAMLLIQIVSNFILSML